MKVPCGVGDNQLSSMRCKQKRREERSQSEVGNESGQIKPKTVIDHRLEDIAA